MAWKLGTVHTSGALGKTVFLSQNAGDIDAVIQRLGLATDTALNHLVYGDLKDAEKGEKLLRKTLRRAALMLGAGGANT
ncbi:hypothetical protein AIOL_003631 [Candidatus Rhodobacter oscarellae]|uniref:Uncharacterized protein n=1 Tax=Candidatus Rhodobacter oscarellae TaxID=1675527 RepID=A0A0J9GYW4_9RHOB|nr:hypothetical protein [Candidatus Rhodobacter lobularis]KMW58653.1 hypothetical protein AIOL_003631 [Candidatus Rhodobacter lobularis]